MSSGRDVLVVSTYPPRRCGIGSYARATVERMREAGDTVLVVSPPDGDGGVRVPFAWGRPFWTAARMGSGFGLIQVQYQPGLYDRPGWSPSKLFTSFALLWLVVRRPQTEIVVHEFERPVRWRPDHALLRRAFRRARLVFHTEEERRRLEHEYRIHAKARLVDHREGVRITSAMGRDAARRHLDIPLGDTLFLCAGFLHPDKGFDRAVQAFAGRPGERLVILGSVRDSTPANLGYARSLRELCARTPGAELIEEYVSDEEFDAWIQAADRVLLPYGRSWSSGALARAQRLGTPAIVSAVGGLPEQAGPLDAVVQSDDELTDAMAAVRTKVSNEG